MMLTITFRTSNANFDPDPAPEIAKILKSVSEQTTEQFTGVADGEIVHHRKRIRDSNGNTIGYWEYLDDRMAN